MAHSFNKDYEVLKETFEKVWYTLYLSILYTELKGTVYTTLFQLLQLIQLMKSTQIIHVLFGCFSLIEF